ncbi:MAG: MarR family winged helix-turn-helix transcriptional regulator [Gemmatimonadota bacterium]
MPPALASRYAGADRSPGFLLWRASLIWQRLQREALEDLGLTHVQFVLLAGVVWLSGGGEPLTQVQLAEHAGTDVMMTSQVLRTLERKGLIRRVAHPTDSRARALTPTRAGRALAERAVRRVEEVDAMFFERAGMKTEQLARVLGRLVSSGG